MTGLLSAAVQGSLPAMADHRDHSRRAHATWLRVVSAGIDYQAAVVAGESEAELTAMRGRCHDLLDAFLDRMNDAGAATADILKD